MAAHLGAQLLQFPSKEVIVTHLNKDSRTNNPYLQEERVIELVAAYFADQSKCPCDVRIGIIRSLIDHDLEAFPLSESSLLENFTQVLIACARENLSYSL